MNCLKQISIKGFIEASFIDWPGNICSILFLPQCNFRCSYCHNADLVLCPEKIKDIPFNTIMSRVREFKGWVDGICVTGGEPTLHACLPSLFSAIQKEGFLTKLDTNGSHPEVLEYLIHNGLVDYVAMDIKSPLFEEAYYKITGVPFVLQSVKKSIAVLLGSNIAYEFRFTVVPALHPPECIYQLAGELKGARKLRLQNFNPAHTLDPKLKCLRPYHDEELKLMQHKVDRLLAKN